MVICVLLLARVHVPFYLDIKSNIDSHFLSFQPPHMVSAKKCVGKMNIHNWEQDGRLVLYQCLTLFDL